jgi:hypothetical protein
MHMLAGPKAGVRRIAATAMTLSVCAALLVHIPASAATTSVQTVADAGGACGSLEIGSSGSKDVLAAENCFSKAYTNCDAALISVGYHGGDAGVSRTFETMRNQNSDACQIAEVVDHYKGSNVASSDTYLCNDVKQAGDGLTFKNCGAEGDVFVPTDLGSSSAKKLMTLAYAFRLAV